MAFLRFANAMVVKPQITTSGWSKVRTASVAPAVNLMAQAEEILGEPLDPARFLISHCTIVASVDVEKVPNVVLGNIKVGKHGRVINRKFDDYYVTPDTFKYINNNGDCWSRDVLLMSFKTFIAGQNYQEHVQIEEQSKGRLIDAVARDIGESVYIDILVATDRKHKQLIQDILDEKMSTLSMGCTTAYTICTKCGNVAADETDLCPCIKYEKLNKFMDERGQQRVIAELCGHPSLGETAGVEFIEASWVANPAFKGAVIRNILDPVGIAKSEMRVQAELNRIPQVWQGSNYLKAASSRQAFDFGEEDGGGEEEAAPEEAPKDNKSKLEDLADKVEDQVTKKVEERVQKELEEEDVKDAISPEKSSIAPNNSIIRQAYTQAVGGLLRTASSEVAFVDGLASLNLAYGIEIPLNLYRVAVKVGSLSAYPSQERYLTTCSHVVGSNLNSADARTLVRIGKLLSRMGK